MLKPFRSLFLLLMLLASSFPDKKPDFRVGSLAHKPIAEASGIVASRRYPGIFWVHNDSGNDATIYAVKSDGALVAEFPVEAPNIDWEDIAIDDSGHLFLGDIGNNGARLPLRCVYQLDEPDPTKQPVGKLKPTATTYYRFPATARFDAESLFVEGRFGYLISKRFDGREAEIFQIPIDPPSSFLKPAVAERIGVLSDFNKPATGADLSKNGQLLAVCSTENAKVYQRTGPASWTKIATIKDIGRGIEAICWDGFDLVLASENRDMFCVPESRWRVLVKD